LEVRATSHDAGLTDVIMSDFCLVLLQETG